MNTIRLLKDNQRVIVVFENANEEDCEKIRKLIGEMMLPTENEKEELKIEKVPFSDNVTENVEEIKEEIEEFVEEELANDKFTPATKEFTKMVADTRYSAGVLLEDTDKAKPVLTTKLTPKQLVELVKKAKVGKKFFYNVEDDKAIILLYSVIAKYLAGKGNDDFLEETNNLFNFLILFIYSF